MSRNNQKILALTLAIILVFSMSVAVSAESTQFNYREELSPDGYWGSYREVTSDLAEVKITVLVPDALYSFDVSWDELVFEYEFSEWDPVAHEYIDGAWDKTRANISVINNSNAGVTLDAIYDDYYNSVDGIAVGLSSELSSDMYYYYDMTRDGLRFSLSSADAYYGGNYAEFYVHVDGTPTNAEAVTQRAVGKVVLAFSTGSYWW